MAIKVILQKVVVLITTLKKLAQAIKSFQIWSVSSDLLLISLMSKTTYLFSLPFLCYLLRLHVSANFPYFLTSKRN